MLRFKERRSIYRIMSKKILRKLRMQTCTILFNMLNMAPMTHTHTIRRGQIRKKDKSKIKLE